MLTDSSVHWSPSTQAAPVVGSTYQDATFLNSGPEVIRRVVSGFQSENYCRNGFWSANGTYFLYQQSDGWSHIKNATTGADVSPEIGQFSTVTFDPVDDDIAWWFSGANMIRYVISTNTQSTYKTFPASIQHGNDGVIRGTGGSVDFVSLDGNIWLIPFGDNIYVWKKSTDTLYANPMPFTDQQQGSYTGISSNGNWVITAMNSWSYGARYVNHVTQSLDATTTKVVDRMGGDHGDFLTCSNGVTYIAFCAGGITSYPWHIAMRVHALGSTVPINRSGWSEAAQFADSITLLQMKWGSHDAHFSGCEKYPNLDWVYLSTTGTNSPATACQEEVLMLNVLTGEKRRWCHHRSGTYGTYENYPRVNAHWAGTKALFASSGELFTPATGANGLYVLETNQESAPTGNIILTVS